MRSIIELCGSAFVLAFFASFILVAVSCAVDPTVGYSTRDVWDEPTRTISVPIFENDSHETGLEFELTEAIIKELQARTPWAITRAEDATATLTGSITSVRQQVMSTSRGTGLVEEMAVRIAVSFEFRDNRAGDVLVSRRNFSASSTYVPARTSSERLAVGQYGAVQRLARDIVSELRQSW